jgi:2-methylcitrate dehydratase PrpD
VAAQFSVRYSIASVLLFGRLGVAEIQVAAILDPRIEDLASRVIVSLDPENTHNYAPVRLKIVKRDGTVIERSVTTYRGNSDTPLSDADMKEKLGMCIEESGRVASASQIDAFFDAIMNIDGYPSMAVATPQILKMVLQ